jgi:hypothetical protein
VRPQAEDVDRPAVRVALMAVRCAVSRACAVDESRFCVRHPDGYARAENPNPHPAGTLQASLLRASLAHSAAIGKATCRLSPAGQHSVVGGALAVSACRACRRGRQRSSSRFPEGYYVQRLGVIGDVDTETRALLIENGIWYALRSRPPLEFTVRSGTAASRRTWLPIFRSLRIAPSRASPRGYRQVPCHTAPRCSQPL